MVNSNRMHSFSRQARLCIFLRRCQSAGRRDMDITYNIARLREVFPTSPQIP